MQPINEIKETKHTFNNRSDYKWQKRSQKQKNIKPDGLDVEFSQELADQDDLEAQARSKAADERAKARK